MSQMTRLPDNWQEITVDLINEKVPSARYCPVCGGKRMLDDVVVSPPAKRGKESPWYPQAALVCNDCGYTTYHNLVVLGLFDKKNSVNGR